MIPKFRAWDKKGRKMYEVWSINYHTQYINSSNNLPMQRIHAIHFENAELMQFTGLHDKNGKEIYEGDIVQRAFVEEYQFLYPPDEIIFEQNYGWHPHNSYNRDWWEYSVVIGNIYEHPHLLKEGVKP